MKTVETVKPIGGTFAGCCRFESFSFGSIRIDGVTYEHDVMIDRGEVSKRKKKPSQQFRDAFGHTPLSTEEEIPWKCHQLVSWFEPRRGNQARRNCTGLFSLG